MEYRVFSISAHGGEGATEELIRFVRSQRVVHVHEQLVHQVPGKNCSVSSIEG